MNNYLSTDTTYSVTGLSASTMYDVYVRAICAPGDTSAWTGPVSFMTAPSLPAGVSCNTGVSTPIWSDELDAQGGWTGDFGLGNGSWLAGGPGGTVSGGTGPLQAQSGSGYFFFESSTGGLDTATIVSPAIDLSTAMDDAELTFWVHGHGADIGTLIVTASTSANITQVALTDGTVSWDAKAAANAFLLLEEKTNFDS